MPRLFALLAAFLLFTGPATADPAFWKHEWPKTDFTHASIESWAGIKSGGPPKDGIPAIDEPTFRKAASETRIKPTEPVITVQIGDAPPRAYPIRYLIWHEIVNDTVGGVPVAVTFCPLCNSGVTFDRRTAHGTLDFGVSGKLRNSDMIMYDRQTESWWQQAQGEAIVGELTGVRLRQLPTWMESWATFRAQNPGGLVMDQPDFPRQYGRNPYGGYDSLERPFLYDGAPPPHGIPALARVVRVGDAAWPLTRIRAADSLTENGITLSWESGQASALDTASIAKGKDVGTVRVRDAEGRNLAHDVMFAFAFDAFWPEGAWMIGN